MVERERIINNYIDAYNRFDVEGMLTDLEDNIVFENISDGEPNMSLAGISVFREEAEQAKNYFSSRKQTVESYRHTEDETEIVIKFQAILAVDLPDGLKKGDELRLEGRSIFKFLDNKIIKLTDIS